MKNKIKPSERFKNRLHFGLSIAVVLNSINLFSFEFVSTDLVRRLFPDNLNINPKCLQLKITATKMLPIVTSQIIRFINDTRFDFIRILVIILHVSHNYFIMRSDLLNCQHFNYILNEFDQIFTGSKCFHSNVQELHLK